MKTTKIILFALSLLAIAATGFAENIILENQTNYPLKNQKSKIAIQWAASAKDVDEGNKALIYGSQLKPESVQALNQSGKIDVTIPEKAESFRVLVWSKGEGDPDFLTNWVDVVPNKTYTLKQDHLIPSVLMSGTGC
jgi:hypothetical protein